MQQTAPNLRVHDISEANKKIKEAKDLDPTILLRRLSGAVSGMEVWNVSDASFGIVSGRLYGQTGIITGLKIWITEGDCTYHIIDWASTKQRRVSHSSYGAEILACAGTDYRDFY